MRRVHRGAFAAPTLASTLAQSSLSAQDRGFVSALVYGSLRYELALDAQLKPYLKRPEKLPHSVRDSLRLGAYERLYREAPKRAVVHSWVEIVKRHEPKLAGLVNAVLQRVEARDLPLATAAGLPTWLVEAWLEQFGEALTARMLEDCNQENRLWLRLFSEHASSSLGHQGCVLEAGPLPGTIALKLPANLSLQDTLAYQKGWIQPQNPASVLVAENVAAAPGERVLDLASGNGIKAAILAAAGAEVTCVELHPGKLGQAAKNLGRLGLKAAAIAHDLRHKLDLPAAPKVLLDAPCSGTGTLRAHPELRSRVSEEEVAALAALQRTMLDSAAPLVAPGGTLHYAVCALTPAEGPEQAQAFLQRHPQFTPEHPQLALPTQSDALGQTILPLNALDGFYLAVFRRRA